MKPEQRLDDQKLLNDYIWQLMFMGELSNRFEPPLPFKCESLTKDPKLAGSVRAVITYCQTYICFTVLLTTDEGKLSEIESE